MRVVRTEFYFAQKEINLSASQKPPEYPGISVAWFKNPDVDGVVEYIVEGSNPLLSGLLDQEPEEEMFDSEPNMVVVEEAKHFLDASLYESAMASLSGPLRNKEIVDYLLRQEIIIERSPPETVSLMSLLSHGTHVGIGSLLGYTIAGGDIPLMCLTVPAGVMVMGAAAGVSNGLKSGLQKTIEKLFKVTKSAAPERRRRRIRKDVVQGKITAKKEPPANKA